MFLLNVFVKNCKDPLCRVLIGCKQQTLDFISDAHWEGYKITLAGVVNEDPRTETEQKAAHAIMQKIYG